MSTDRVIRIKGKRYIAPNDVIDVEAYRQYLLIKDQLSDKEARKHTFSNGLTVTLPYAGLETYAVLHNISRTELDDAKRKGREFSKLNGLASQQKKIAYTGKAGYNINLTKNYFSDNQSYALELFGRYFSIKQVHKHLVNEGHRVSYEDTFRFYTQNKEKIRELRNKAKEDLDDLSVGVKRSRLEKLDYLVGDLMEYYDKQTPMNRLPFSKEIRGLLEQARKEVEGDELKLTVNGRIDINATIELAMNKTSLIQDLTIIQMVLSRVAARTGVNYNKLVTRLANSFYSKFNGMRVNSDLSQKPIYPSSVNYDIFEMRPIVENLYRTEDTVYTEVIDVKDPIKIEEANEAKDRLAELLRGRLQSNKKEKNQLISVC